MGGRRGAACWVVLVLAASGTMVVRASAQTTANQPDALRTLMASIPSDYRAQCTILDPANAGPVLAPMAATITAAVDCGGIDELSTLRYVQFTDDGAMNQAYQRFSPGSSAGPFRDAAAQCPGEHTWGFGSAADDGYLACYYSSQSADGTTHDESVVDAWTYGAGDLLGIAETHYGDSNASALHDWWNSHAAPLEHPSPPRGFGDWRGSDRAALRALLTHVPPKIRTSCHDQPRTDPTSAFYDRRLWARAVVLCTSGVFSVVYLAADRGVVDDIVAGDRGTDSSDAQCPGSGTWSVGTGKKRHQVGDYVCYTSGSNRPEVIWSQHDVGVLAAAGYAGAPGDFDTLMHWWNGDVGPI